MTQLSRLFAVLHSLSGLILLLFSGWFIAACAIAGVDYADINFNYLLPAVLIRALALIRIASGYAQMWTGHQALLETVKSLRLNLFSRLKNQRIRRRAEGTEALAKHSEAIASLNMAWTAHNLGALFMVLLVTGVLVVWLPKLLWLWALFCGVLAVLFVVGFQRILAQGKQLLRLTTAFRHDSEHHLSSAGIWHLRDTLTHSNMLATYQQIEQQRGIGERLLWWTQAVAYSVLLYALWVGEYRGQAVLMVFVLLLLAAKDWLAPMLRSQNAFADYRDSQATFNHLPLAEIPDAAVQPAVIRTLTLQDFSAENRPVPTIEIAVNFGECVLLKGGSGSGKTTLLQAIAGLLPHTGEKIVNGESIPAGFISAWHYADQTPMLLSASLATNLRLAAPDADDDKLREALQFADLAHLTDFNEWLGAQGRQLSGGELKRLNIARAYLFDAQLYLFDEPFEGLDSARQEKLAAAINALSQHAPVVVASHIVPSALVVSKRFDLTR